MHKILSGTMDICHITYPRVQENHCKSFKKRSFGEILRTFIFPKNVSFTVICSTSNIAQGHFNKIFCRQMMYGWIWNMNHMYVWVLPLELPFLMSYYFYHTTFLLIGPSSPSHIISLCTPCALQTPLPPPLTIKVHLLNN